MNTNPMYRTDDDLDELNHAIDVIQDFCRLHNNCRDCPLHDETIKGVKCELMEFHPSVWSNVDSERFYKYEDKNNE